MSEVQKKNSDAGTLLLGETGQETGSEEDSELSDFEGMSKRELIRVVHSHFSGPLPDPATMKRYEEILPGAADRILRIAENEQLHRHEMEIKMLKEESRDSLTGILSALAVTIVILSFGTIISLNVPSVAGVIAGTVMNITGIASIVGQFLGRDKKDKEE